MRKAKDWLCGALALSKAETPFPWQLELLNRFSQGEIERSIDIPTGLGKTAVMAIWLVARALGAKLPRRLVYVVDRRAVVDQATDVAIRLRDYVDCDTEFKHALALEGRSLPISTLRGQHIDNREWLEDPTSPAIIVGTVDMIGSRLLFEGYGTSRKMRSYQAGLLGADVLLVLDEAHLVPPFESLLDLIATKSSAFGPRDEGSQLIPPFRLMALSATARSNGSTSFGLTQADFEHEVVTQRLYATKRLEFVQLSESEGLPKVLADQAWALAGKGKSAVRIIVFCDKPKDAEDAKVSVEKLAKDDKKEVDAELFVGGRRVYERGQAACWLRTHGFLADKEVELKCPAIVFATSAGEVGVDLDGDHMVSDLVAWERMIQRLGRVNRRGGRVASVVVAHELPHKPEVVLRLAALKSLPQGDGGFDASPGAIHSLKMRAEADSELKKVLDDATTPSPLRPALSRALVDAWSMTSLEKHTGRPEVQPWLRGWVEEEAQTTVVWRKHLPVKADGSFTDKEINAYFEAASPHLSEKLEIETHHVMAWLSDRAKALLKASNSYSRYTSEGETNNETSLLSQSDVAAIALNTAGEVSRGLRLTGLDLSQGDTRSRQAKRNDLRRILSSATLVIDARVAGLREGRLDHKAEDPPRTLDDGEKWLPTDSGVPVIRFRVRDVADTAAEPASEDGWLPRFRLATKLSAEGEEQRWLVVDKWRHDASTEDDRSAGPPQLLDVHQQWAEGRSREIAQLLGLPQDYTEMLAVTARLHDEGKRARCWQRAFNAPGDGDYAKTAGPIKHSLLDGYRHEFGSLEVAEREGPLAGLSADLRELALHLIAAHHGFARPLIRTDGCENAPPSVLENRARDITLRFARLQKKWGPWGLAWWEALLRAADHQASRDNDNQGVGLAVAKEKV